MDESDPEDDGWPSWTVWRGAPASMRIALIGAAIMLVGGFAGGLLGRGIYDLWIGNDDGTYKILVTLAGVIGAPFVAWRTLVAHQQTGIARETHFTTLFTRAVEQLGATREITGDLNASGPAEAQSVSRTEANYEVRLGAIYALERIAQDSKRDHGLIMEVLCAYVRNRQNCGTPVPAPADASERPYWYQDIRRARVDVQAALSVIGRRSKDRLRHERDSGLKLDFSGANLQRAVLRGNFSDADLAGADLTGATIENCIWKGNTFGTAKSLNGVTIMESQVEFFSFWGATAKRVRGIEAYNSILAQSNFRGLEMRSCSFSGCDLKNSYFRYALLSRVDFHSCNLTGARFDNVSLDRVTFFGIDAERSFFFRG